MLRKLEKRVYDRQRFLPGRHGGDSLAHAHALGQFGLPFLFQRRFVIEQVDLRGPASHEQVNDALGRRRKVRFGERGLDCRRRRLPPKERRVEQRGEGHGPNASGGPAEKVAAGHEQPLVAGESGR